MCGLIGAINYQDNKKTKPADANQFVISQLQDQLSRGQRGFGIVFINPDRTFKIERATELTKVIVDLYLNKSQMIFLHHRTPTSSDNKISQTHPIAVKNPKLKHDYYFMHNGVIHNEDDRRLVHEQAGFKYSTLRKDDSAYKKEQFNDTEALAIDFARYIEGLDSTIPTVGSAAFICLQVDKTSQKVQRVYCYRNSGSPLNLAMSRGVIKMSSEGPGDSLTEGLLYHFDLGEFKLKKRKLTINTYTPTTTVVSPTNTERSYHSYGGTSQYGYWDARGNWVKYEDTRDTPPAQDDVDIEFDAKLKEYAKDEEEYEDDDEADLHHDWYLAGGDPVQKDIQDQIAWDADRSIDTLNSVFEMIADPDLLYSVDDDYINGQLAEIAQLTFRALEEARERIIEINKDKKPPTGKQLEIVLPEKLTNK
jgi:predicted glutamine amidotransferase